MALLVKTFIPYLNSQFESHLASKVRAAAHVKVVVLLTACVNAVVL